MASAVKALSLLALLATLTGCGSPSGRGNSSTAKEHSAQEESAVRFLIAELQAASRDGDAERICNQIFTPRLANSVTSASNFGSCAEEVKENLYDPRERLIVEEVDVVNPVTATAVVKESNGKASKVSFVKQGGEWRIRSVGPA
jgi:hypothetical protein